MDLDETAKIQSFIFRVALEYVPVMVLISDLGYQVTQG